MLFYRQGMRFLTRDCVTGAIVFIKGNDMPLDFSMACILKFGPVTCFFNGYVYYIYSLEQNFVGFHWKDQNLGSLRSFMDYYNMFIRSPMLMF